MAWIHQELKRPGVTLQRRHLEYLAREPDGYRYSQFCRHYHDWARALAPTMRQIHRAGEKAFVDFSGKRPVISDVATGEVRPVELFVGALGASSYVYAEACPSQDLAAWISAHVRMVEFFGGAPAIFVPDNLRSGVTQACRYEPIINRTYLEFAQHYGAAVVPARAGHPRDKAVVEANVLVAQRWILAVLRHRRFFSLAELNAAIRELLAPLNARPMRKLGVSRRVLFEQLDRPLLRPLPTSRYEFAEWRDAGVNIDYHVLVEHNYYSVPYQLVHQRVEVRLGATTVELFLKGRRVASHRRHWGAASTPRSPPTCRTPIGRRRSRRLRARAALARPPEHPRPGLLHPRGDDAMLAHATVDKLTALRLPALAEALHRQLGNPEFAELSFEDRLGLLVDAEWTHREQRKLRRRLRAANLRRQASLEDIDWHSPPRGLDKAQLPALATCAWIAE